jgi:hypothetical protein
MRPIENFRASSPRVFAGALLILLGYLTSPAQAQGVFCPTVVPPGTTLQSGLCTNGNTGALSTAALSSQSLSEISQSSTQQSNRSTIEAIQERRKEETDRCPAGYKRVDGDCRKIANAPAPRAPARAPAEVFYKATPAQVEPAVRPAVWAYAFGGSERRTGESFPIAGPSLFTPVAGVPNVCGNGGVGLGACPGIVTPSLMTVNINSQTATWGFVAGGDLTFHNVTRSGDVLIAGLLGGYVSSDVKLNATGISSNPAAAGNGSSANQIRLNGPSVGAFVTYFAGPFSSDLTLKADFLNLSETFVEVFNFNAGGPLVQFSGTGSANVDNLSVIGNANYRIPISNGYWFEPTVGFNYTYSFYDGSAAALGLSDGYVLRLQGGARLGSESLMGTVRVTTTVTGLAYDDVKIVGGPIANGAFVGGSIIPNDAGLLRGEGIFAMNFDYGNGYSWFAQGAVYGGKDLFGVAGKGGVRWQW